MSLKISLALYGIGESWTFDATRTVVQEAERLGFDGVFHQDNLTGHHPMPREWDVMSAWPTLSALAACTSTIRLGTLATPAPRRYAPLLAKDIATLDRISGGRVTVGLGAGDDRFQYDMIGQPFPERRERLKIVREAAEAMKMLWTGKPSTYDGEYVRLSDAVMAPLPMQQPNPPIWLTGNTSRQLTPHLAADIADGYAVMWGDDKVVERGITAFRDRWAENGRPEEELNAVRVMYVLMGDGVDHDAEFTRLTGTPMDFSGYASTARVEEGSDPAGFVRGRPDQIAQQLMRRTTDLGFNHLVVHPLVFGSAAVSELDGWAGSFLAAIRILASEVLSRPGPRRDPQQTFVASRENVETVLAVYAAVGAGDVDTALSFFSDDALLDADWESNSAQLAGVPWMAARRGIDELRTFIGLGEAMHIVRLEPGVPMHGGRKVAVEVEFEKTTPDVRDTECHVFTFDEAGKIVSMRHYLDTAKHIAAHRVADPVAM